MKSLQIAGRMVWDQLPGWEENEVPRQSAWADCRVSSFSRAGITDTCQEWLAHGEACLISI